MQLGQLLRAEDALAARPANEAALAGLRTLLPHEADNVTKIGAQRTGDSLTL